MVFFHIGYLDERLEDGCDSTSSRNEEDAVDVLLESV